MQLLMPVVFWLYALGCPGVLWYYNAGVIGWVVYLSAVATLVTLLFVADVVADAVRGLYTRQ